MNLKAISEVLSAVKDYLFPYEKISKKFLKINNEDDLINFIKEKSAFVTQSTLYGYLKTRMGLKQNMMFTDDIFIESVNKAKWNIFSEAVTDLTVRGGRTSEGRQLYTDQTPAGNKAAIRFLHLGEALAPS